jgi:hypothetical protein
MAPLQADGGKIMNSLGNRSIDRKWQAQDVRTPTRKHIATAPRRLFGPSRQPHGPGLSYRSILRRKCPSPSSSIGPELLKRPILAHPRLSLFDSREYPWNRRPCERIVRQNDWMRMGRFPDARCNGECLPNKQLLQWMPLYPKHLNELLIFVMHE